MPKSGVVGGARPTQARKPIQLPSAVQGRIAELCRDLAVEAKRMRQLHEQADELRMEIRQWVSQSELDSPHEPANRAGRR